MPCPWTLCDVAKGLSDSSRLHLHNAQQLVAAEANFACEVKGEARPEPQRASRDLISASLVLLQNAELGHIEILSAFEQLLGNEDVVAFVSAHLKVLAL